MKQFRGKCFDEFNVGDKIETSYRKITKEDVLTFAKLSGDNNPLHIDEEFAKGTIFGRQIAHGMLTASIVTGLAAELGIFEGTVIAFMGVEAKFLAPVYFDDSIKTEIIVDEKKDANKVDRDVAVFLCRAINQDDTVVAECRWTIMLKRKR